MPDLLVRGLDTRAVKRLKDRARRNGRSLQSEAKRVLEEAAGKSGAEVAALLERWRDLFARRRLSRSADLIREDRGR